MADGCNCDSGLFNLQPATCVKTPGIQRKVVFVEYKKADGTVNGIDLSSPFGETEIDALIAQSDKTLRWYLSPRFRNFTSERADPNTETVDNENLFLSQGTRTVGGNFYSTSPAISKRLDGNRCIDLGYFIIDSANGISGVFTRDLFLDPIRINKESFWSKVNFATEANAFNVQFNFEWDRLVCDGDIRTLGFEDHGTDLINKSGLITVDARDGVANLATEIAISFYTTDGSAKGSPFTGLVLGDFTVTNTTTDSAIVASAAVESPDGTYTLTIPAQTTGDKITVTAASAGFDFADTVNEVITAL